MDDNEDFNPYQRHEELQILQTKFALIRKSINDKGQMNKSQSEALKQKILRISTQIDCQDIDEIDDE